MNISKIQTSVNKAYFTIGNPVENMKEFYKEGLNNPMLALIVEQDEINIAGKQQLAKGHSGFCSYLTSRDSYMKLKDILESSPEKAAFWEKFKTLYPETGLLKLTLLRFGRVNMDNVTEKADDQLRQALKRTNRFFK